MSTSLPPHAWSFYRATQPTSLATAPEWFSFSTLKGLEACPRQWQLQHSPFPGVSGPYPQPHAAKRVAGVVIHRFLQRLLPRLAAAGYPARGDAAFASMMADFDPRATMEGLLDEELEVLHRNPRAWRERDLGVKSRDLLNSAYRLLEKSYHPRTEKAAAAGAAPAVEQGLRHPTLPLKGFLDLVIPRPDGDHIVDYKSGDYRPEYAEQLQIYALLWWRARGRVPARLRVILTEHTSEVVEFPVREEELERLEERLGEKISSLRLALQGGLAPAHPDPERCRWCPVRQVCEAYWSSSETASLREPQGTQEQRLDLELEKPRLTSDHSLVAQAPAGGPERRVVTDASFGSDLQHLQGVRRARLLGATVRPDGIAVLGGSAEAFALTGSPGDPP